MEVGDFTLGDRHNPHAQEGQSLKEAGGIFLIPTKSIQRLGEHDVELPVERPAHQRLESRPQQRGARDRMVVEFVRNLPVLTLGNSLAESELVRNRRFALIVRGIKTVPYVPFSHPFVERLVGTMRREFLDHVLLWNGRDFYRKLAEFQTYYNGARCHTSLEGRTPLTFADTPPVTPADLHQVRWVSHCRDLVQLPVAA